MSPKIKETAIRVAEKLIPCAGAPANRPDDKRDYPLSAFIPMRNGIWQEVYGMYGCHDSSHHTVYWDLETARLSMADGDWLIEYHPVARYRCKTGPCDEQP